MSDTLKRMTDRVTAYPCGEGTFLHDAFAPVAVEIDYLFDVLMPAAMDAIMPDTAIGADLDLVAGVYAVTRRAAAYAEGVVTFTGTVGTQIMENVPVSTAAGLLFLVTAAGEIPAGGTVDLPVLSLLDGARGNVDALAIDRLPTPIVGISAVSNALAISGGADLESDDGLRARLLLRLRMPSASGTQADYIRWALEVSGVGAAQCVPLWDGPGTVKVIITGADGAAADAETIERCEDYIETVRPVGAAVTVVSATPLTVNVSVALSLETGYTNAALQTPVEEALEIFLTAYGFGSTSLSYARLGAALLAIDGINDYATLTINGAAENLSILAVNILTLGTVTLL